MTPSPVTGLAGKLRNPVAVWLLAPLTLGIYGLVWYYKANKETRDMGVVVNPGTSLLAITLGAFIIVPPFVSIYKTGERIAQAQLAAGMPQTCNPALGLILWIFVFGTGPLYYQGELNKIWARYGNPPAGTQIPVAPIQQAVGYQPQGYQPQGYQPQGQPQGYQPQGQPQDYLPQGYPAGGQAAPPAQPQGYPAQPQGYPAQPQGYPAQPQGYPTGDQAAPPAQPPQGYYPTGDQAAPPS